MTSDKKIILFGAGLYGKQGLRYFGIRSVHCFVDNNKHGEFILGKRVISFDELLAIHHEYDVVISSGIGALESIKAQCDSAGIQTVYLSDIIDIDAFESDPRLVIFKNKHEGKRCFLVGNGPSLKAEDLERIHTNGDITFGCNAIYRIFSNTSWRPDYYFAADTFFLIESGNEIVKLDIPVKFISNLEFDFSNQYRLSDMYANGNDIYIYNSAGLINITSLPRFSHDPSRCIYIGKTVMYSMLQWAAYMGFKSIYLIGVDCTPAPLSDPDSHKVKGHFYDMAYDEAEEESYIEYKYKNSLFSLSKNNYLRAWINAYTSAEAYSRDHGFRIYNATRGGQLEVFERVCFDSLF